MDWSRGTLRDSQPMKILHCIVVVVNSKGFRRKNNKQSPINRHREQCGTERAPGTCSNPSHTYIINMIGVHQEVKEEGVLFLAFFVIASLSMNEQHCEIDNVKVGDGGVKASREAPCKCHQEVAPWR